MKKISCFIVRIIVPVCLIAAGGRESRGQSLSIFDADTSAFPAVTARYYALDTTGAQVFPTASDFLLYENGIRRQVTSVTCPSHTTPISLSSVVTIDVSGSMATMQGSVRRLDLAKVIANGWVGSFGMEPGECAITSFDALNYFNQDFTRDTSSLHSAINAMEPQGGTDYNEAFTEPLAGALIAVANGTHRRIVILISDGLPNFPPNVANIVAKAQSLNTAVYAITIGMDAPQCLHDICEQTGGHWFEKIETSADIQNVVHWIFLHASGEGACTVQWKSAPACEDGIRHVVVNLLPSNATATLIYKTPKSGVSILDISPLTVRFGGVPPHSTATMQCTVTAKNAPWSVTDIKSNNPQFTVSPTSFDLDPGINQVLTIKYSPGDSGFSYAEFDVQSNMCSTKIYADGGYPAKSPIRPNLQVVAPNGGEAMLVGSDSSLDWGGVASGDTVSLEYTTNGGSDWTMINHDALGLRIPWAIPNTPSTHCLLRARQHDNFYTRGWAKQGMDESYGIAVDVAGSVYVTGYVVQGSDSIYFLTKYLKDGSIAWTRSGTGLGANVSTCISVDALGDIYIAGWFDPGAIIGGTIPVSNGSRDLFVAKYHTDGSLAWVSTGGSTGFDIASVVVSDNAGSVYLGGSVRPGGIITFGSIALPAYFNEHNPIIVKFQSSTGTPISALQLGSGYLTALIPRTSGKLTLLINEGAMHTWNGSHNFAVTNIDSTGIDLGGGFTGACDDEMFANGMAIDSSGNIFVDGYCQSGAGSNGTIIAGVIFKVVNLEEAFIVKCHPDGTAAWVRTTTVNHESNYPYDNSGQAYIYCLAVDAVGNAYLGGSLSHSLIFGNDTVDSKYLDPIVVKYRPDGSVQWVRQAGGYGSIDLTNAIAVSQDGNVYSTGTYKGLIATFDTTKLTGPGYFVWKLDGVPVVNTLQQDLSDAEWSIVAPHVTAVDINMDTVALGNTGDSVVTSFIHNTSGYPCRIDSIYLYGAQAADFNLIARSLPFVLPADSTLPVEIVFTPNAGGNRTTTSVVITQCDTLQQTLSGVGLDMYRLSSALVDFGEVQTGASKDSVLSVVLRNTGLNLLTITNTAMVSANTKDFSVVSGGGPFTLQPGKTQTMTVQFAPSSPGRTSGGVAFYYQGPGSPAIMQLYGKGIRQTAGISTTAQLSFASVLCGMESDTVLRIASNGGIPLTINSASITGANASSFTLITSLAGLSIPVDSFLTVPIRFSQSTIGTASASLVIHSNAEPDSVVTIALSGRKDSVNVAVNINAIDFGTLCPNETKDVTMTLTNNGTAATTVTIQATGAIASAADSVYILPGSNATRIFHFGGSTTPGSIGGSVTLRGTACDHTTTLAVSGKVDPAEMIAADTSMIAEVGQTANGKFTLHNKSDRAITLTALPALPAGFSWGNISLPITLTPFEVVRLDLSFTPKDTSVVATTLVFSGSPCGVSATARLTGHGTVQQSAKATAAISIGTFSGKPGDEIFIPIRLDSSSNVTQSGATRYTTTFHFNETLLGLIDAIPSNVVTRYDSVMTLSLPTQATNGILATLHFRVGLGDDTMSALVLDPPVAQGGAVTVSVQNGVFNLTGICQAGGKRLVNPNGNSQLSLVHPNPVSNGAQVLLNIVETGRTRLQLIDMKGRVAKEFIDGDVGLGKQTISINLSDIANGQYALVLTTPTITQSLMMEVRR